MTAAFSSIGRGWALGRGYQSVGELARIAHRDEPMTAPASTSPSTMLHPSNHIRGRTSRPDPRPSFPTSPRPLRDLRASATRGADASRVFPAGVPWRSRMGAAGKTWPTGQIKYRYIFCDGKPPASRLGFSPKMRPWVEPPSRREQAQAPSGAGGPIAENTQAAVAGSARLGRVSPSTLRLGMGSPDWG
jgi:hypothetical protein